MNFKIRIADVSPSIERLLDYTVDEAVSLHLPDIMTEPSIELVMGTVQEELGKDEENDWYRSKIIEIELKKKDGSTIWAESKVSFLRDDKGNPVGFLGITRDMSEKKKAQEEMDKLQEQLRQSQKMEAVGRLAGGISHDFNNMLTVIRGYSELALMGMKEQGQIKTALTEIHKAGDKAATLTRQLLAFSRKQVMELRVTDMNELIRNLDKMLHRIIGEHIELINILKDGLWQVKIDPVQMEHVIVNLAINARDAMPWGGKIILETSNLELNEQYALMHNGIDAGQYIMLAVSDTGAGIPAEVKDNIFEPFFTTKEKGQGTGLGLSMVYGIVKQSRGHIFVYSEPGKGTTFKIYIPISKDEVEKKQEKVSADKIPSGNETVLLVEDNKEVMDLVGSILEKLGYRTIMTSSGKEALAFLETGQEPIHLLLTDVVMPHMSGKELADRIKSLYPKVKILFMSGYTDDAIADHGILDKDMNLISKPFTMDALARKIRQVID